MFNLNKNDLHNFCLYVCNITTVCSSAPQNRFTTVPCTPLIKDESDEVTCELMQQRNKRKLPLFLIFDISRK